MPVAFQSVKIFLCSPGDVAEERDIARDVILKVNQNCRDTLGLRAEHLRWEDMRPTAVATGTIQEQINIDLVRNCNIFVLILYKRYGSVPAGGKRSHTEEEIDLALHMLKETKKITILTYFRDLGPNEDQGSQERRVRDLRKRLEKQEVLYDTYRDPQDFRDQFTHDLYHTMLRFRMSTSKQKALRKFWNLGVSETHKSPALAIIYPPVNRSFMRAQDPDQYWLERLVPHVVFEDFKALQKIDKTLRLIGHSDIRTYTTFNYPQDILDINRLWLCMPRNVHAQKQLRKYQQQARFSIQPKKGNTPCMIEWKTPNGNPLKIKSPLSTYLHEQRAAIPGGEWRAEHGRVAAKDYAVLARFSEVDDTNPIVSENKIKDYFLAGIRGLGTWGAGWFIDRRYNAFNAYEEWDDQPIQLLLEVTFSNEQISNVVDVSDQPQEYFDEQNSLKKVREVINEYQA